MENSNQYYIAVNHARRSHGGEHLKRAALGNFNYHTLHYQQTRKDIKARRKPGLFARITEHFRRNRETWTGAEK